MRPDLPLVRAGGNNHLEKSRGAKACLALDFSLRKANSRSCGIFGFEMRISTMMKGP
jgi:hypothetical protein